MLVTSWASRHPRWTVAVLVVVVLLAFWGVNLWQLARSVQDRAQYWSQPRGETGGLLYVALGDSAAQGIGASTVDRGYVALIAEQLERSSGRPVQVVNLSRSGAKVRDVVTHQLPALARLRPDLVTVDVGGNDMRGYDPAGFRRDVATLVAGLPAGSVVADVPYFMHGRSQRDAAEAARTLTEQAMSRGLTVAPLHVALRGKGWQAMFTGYAPDWFHPNDRGYRTWFDAFWQVIAPLPVAQAR